MIKVITITVDELRQLIADVVSDAISKMPQQTAEKPVDETYLTRKETAKIIGITTPTLLSRTLAGEISAYRTGRRVLYRRSEVDEYVSKRKINVGK